MAKIRIKKLCVMKNCSNMFLPQKRTDKTCSRECSRDYQLELMKLSKFRRGIFPTHNMKGKKYILKGGFVDVE